LCLLLLGAALAAPPIQGQESAVIAGRVLDQEGKPVAGLEVLLHRVAGQQGDRIGTAVSAPDGTFRFPLTEAPTAGAVYFATVRFEGEVFIGAFLEPPFEADKPYDVVVGGEPISFEAMTMPAGGGTGAPAAPQRSRKWALAIVPLLAVVGAAIASLLARRGQRQRRHLLIRLAVLEEEAAAQGESEGLRQERARILEELGGRLAS
jgi:5-hydroxyisourate hydrolase-like protein (transthyretin family)